MFLKPYVEKTELAQKQNPVEHHVSKYMHECFMEMRRITCSCENNI